MTPTNQSVEVTLTAKFTAIVTGAGPFTYQWQRGNEILIGETKSTYTVHNASMKDQNYYSCSIYNVYGDPAASNIVWLQVTSMYLMCLYIYVGNIATLMTHCAKLEALYCRHPAVINFVNLFHIYVTRSDKIGLIAKKYTCSYYGTYHSI